jgi:hypothetical protein
VRSARVGLSLTSRRDRAQDQRALRRARLSNPAPSRCTATRSDSPCPSRSARRHRQSDRTSSHPPRSHAQENSVRPWLRHRFCEKARIAGQAYRKEWCRRRCPQCRSRRGLELVAGKLSPRTPEDQGSPRTRRIAHSDPRRSVGDRFAYRFGTQHPRGRSPAAAKDEPSANSGNRKRQPQRRPRSGRKWVVLRHALSRYLSWPGR